MPWIGTTVDYIKFGPSSGERFHKELGPIYRYEDASAAVMDELRVKDMLVQSESTQTYNMQCCVDRSWLLGEKIVHVADADAVKLLLTCEHDLVQGAVTNFHWRGLQHSASTSASHLALLWLPNHMRVNPSNIHRCLTLLLHFAAALLWLLSHPHL